VWIDYSPPDAWLYCVQAVIYLAVVALVARSFPRFALAATFVVFLGGTIAFWAYHATHNEPRYRQVFMDYEQVTPYHEQLAIPFFMTLIAAIVIATWSRLRTASAPRG
jgi:hypothetical protein